jgi:short-subunit dehydrogenase
MMTNLVLPTLLDRAKDGKRSGMINISSGAAYFNMQAPLYSGTKAFNLTLSVALSRKYKS